MHHRVSQSCNGEYIAHCKEQMEEQAISPIENFAGPAKVYPASAKRDSWMVEPPRTEPAEDIKAFDGPNAQVMAVGCDRSRDGPSPSTRANSL
jgi:hypothetical protein